MKMESKEILSIYEKIPDEDLHPKCAVDFVYGEEDKVSSGEGWEKTYSMDVLNTSISADEIVGMVKNAVEFAKDKKCSDQGIKILFYGCSGSGKSQLAKYIANEIHRNVFIRYASDVLSKWVGQSEKNLAETFDIAEKTGDVLVFDEADTFLANREGGFEWQRSNVNEFLNQIEMFKGILICTSNLPEVMDKAMLRRFHIMVEFKPLKKDGVSVMLKNYFDQLEFSERQIERIASFDSATPGDFSILHSRMRFMKKDFMTEDYITGELCRMQEDKCKGNRKIGF